MCPKQIERSGIHLKVDSGSSLFKNLLISTSPIDQLTSAVLDVSMDASRAVFIDHGHLGGIAGHQLLIKKPVKLIRLTLIWTNRPLRHIEVTIGVDLLIAQSGRGVPGRTGGRARGTLKAW